MVYKMQISKEVTQPFKATSNSVPIINFYFLIVISNTYYIKYIPTNIDSHGVSVSIR